MELRALICFEILFGYELARQLGDFDALLYFSDLSWVNNSLLPSQSLLMARMRAIEFAKPVVGVSNLGFSGYIDSSGQVIASAQGKRRQNLDIELTGQKGITPYAQFIDSPLVSLLFASIVLATLIAYRRKILLNSKQMETLYEH